MYNRRATSAKADKSERPNDAVYDFCDRINLDGSCEVASPDGEFKGRASSGNSLQETFAEGLRALRDGRFSISTRGGRYRASHVLTETQTQPVRPSMVSQAENISNPIANRDLFVSQDHHAGEMAYGDSTFREPPTQILSATFQGQPTPHGRHSTSNLITPSQQSNKNPSWSTPVSRQRSLIADVRTSGQNEMNRRRPPSATSRTSEETAVTVNNTVTGVRSIQPEITLMIEQVEVILGQEALPSASSVEATRARFQTRCDTLYFRPGLHQLSDHQRNAFLLSAYEADYRLEYAILQRLLSWIHDTDILRHLVLQMKGRVYTILIGEMRAAYPGLMFQRGSDLLEQYAICLAGCTLTQNQGFRGLSAVSIEDRNNCIYQALEWLPELLDSYTARLKSLDGVLSTAELKAVIEREQSQNQPSESRPRRRPVGRPPGSKNRPTTSIRPLPALPSTEKQDSPQSEPEISQSPWAMPEDLGQCQSRDQAESFWTTNADTRFLAMPMTTPHSGHMQQSRHTSHHSAQDSSEMNEQLWRQRTYDTRPPTFTADDIAQLRGLNREFD